MTTTTMKNLAKHFATKHGLNGWEIYIGDEFFDTVASCNCRKRALWFNEFFFSRCTNEFCKDTILHEIAHALVDAGHNKEWQDKCVEIGAIPLEFSCWENEDFTARFKGMNVPDAPFNVCFPPEDKSKIINIQVNYLVQEGVE